MALRLLQQLSLAVANEDAHAHDAHAALVLDGATPLGPSLLPGPSDAAWIAQFGARRLMAHLKDNTPRDALHLALEDAKRSFEGLVRKPIKERWQIPCAAMMLAVQTEKQSTDFLWFGDCAAIIKIENEPAVLIGEGMESRKREAARARIALDAGISPTERTKTLPLLRAGRGRINSGSSWLFSPEPRAAGHAAHAAHDLAPGTKLLLCSDGFLALASDYGAYDLDGLMAAAQTKTLVALGAELRAIEDADPQARKYPRFKKSDDATALLLEISQAHP